MACTIDATVGGAASNSYSTIAEANAYHEAHIYRATWDDASTVEKCRALQMATRMLDAQVAWLGWIVSSTQALMWPRSGVVGRNGFVWDVSLIPIELKYATAELARALIVASGTSETASDTDGIKRLKAGPVEIEFDGATADPLSIPDAVFYLIQHLGVLRTRGVGSIPLVRV